MELSEVWDELCSDCVTPVIREFFGTKQPYCMCPKCNIDLVSLGVANAIIPFWLRLHKFFTYPLHPTPLFLVLAFSLGNGVFPEEGALNTLMRAGIWGFLFKYAYAVLTNTAQGRLKPPGINSETICKDFFTVFKQSLLFLVIVIGAIVVIQKAGIWLGVLFLVFAILLIPAMIIVLVFNNSLLQAINPMVIVGTALQIGWSYFLMYYFLLLQFGGPAALTRYGAQYLPSHVARFILEFAGGFHCVVSPDRICGFPIPRETWISGG